MKKVKCESRITSLVWSTEEEIITGCLNGKIQHQWKADPTRWMRWTSWNLKGHRAAVNSVDLEPKSRLLVSGSDDKKVIVQKLDSSFSLAPLHTLTGHKSRVKEVKFSPSDSHLLATWDDSCEVRLWDALAGNCLHKFQCDTYGRGIHGLEMNINFSPDGKLLACRGSKVKVLRVATWQLAAVCNVKGKKVCWNTRGNKLAIATNSNNIVVFYM